MKYRRVVEVSCPGGAPQRLGVAALSTRDVGLCAGCGSWCYLSSDGQIRDHVRCELVPA